MSVTTDMEEAQIYDKVNAQIQIRLSFSVWLQVIAVPVLFELVILLIIYLFIHACIPAFDLKGFG